MQSFTALHRFRPDVSARRRREMRTLSHQQAKAFYDRFGAKQDSQAFYEDRAVQELV